MNWFFWDRRLCMETAVRTVKQDAPFSEHCRSRYHITVYLNKPKGIFPRRMCAKYYSTSQYIDTTYDSNQITASYVSVRHQMTSHMTFLFWDLASRLTQNDCPLKFLCYLWETSRIERIVICKTAPDPSRFDNAWDNCQGCCSAKELNAPYIISALGHSC